MFSIFDDFEIFNSTFFYNWFEDELFNQITNFFQHFQQCLHFYCESKLFDWLIIIFVDFVNAWFDDQSKFISLHDFDIVLTNAFFSKSFISSKQQKLKIFSEISKKIVKRTKRNVVKNAKRIKFKILKTEQVAKSTSIVQNIDIFDSIFTCENRRFSDFVKFLQHLQHCQHLYRKSNLLILLSICLDDVAFDIWYNKQNVMSSTSLSEWIEILRIEFVIFAKSISIMICMRCDQNFNIKKTFREHVREQHAKKLVKSFCFDSNIIKLMCKNDEKSTINDSFFAFASQKSDISIAKSKQIIDSTKIFESIVSLKNSRFSFFTSENVSESIKNNDFLMFCYFVEINIFSNVRIKTSRNRYLEIRQRFSFLDQCDQFNMWNREKIIRHARIICEICETCEILKFDIRVCNNIQISHFFKTFEFFSFYTENWIKINKEINNVSTLQKDIQIQEIFSRAQMRTICKEICHQFVFSISFIQISMQSKKEINNQKCDDSVCFAKIAYFDSKISKNR